MLPTDDEPFIETEVDESTDKRVDPDVTSSLHKGTYNYICM